MTYFPLFTAAGTESELNLQIGHEEKKRHLFRKKKKKEEQ